MAGMRSRLQRLSGAIRMVELMKLVPDDARVTVFIDLGGSDGALEEAFSGQALDWWKEEAAVAGAMRMFVTELRSRQSEGTEPELVIVAEF